MIKKPVAIIALIAVLFISVCDRLLSAQIQAPVIKPESGPIICRVIEVFEEGKLGVRVIIFHQRDKAEGPRLGSFLLSHSGEEVELDTDGSHRCRVTVFRVKSCFGRGLAIVPTGELKLSEHDEFILCLPAEK